MEKIKHKIKKSGFTLPELAFGIGVLVFLFVLTFSLIGMTFQKTRVTVAKVAISQYAVLLDTIKGDVNYYPPSVNETLESLSSSAAPTGYGQGWRGPYLKTSPLDPWKTAYFYRLVYGLIFGPLLCPRVTGPPSDETYNFSAVPGEATIVMSNYCSIDHAGTVWLNGVELVPPNDFQKDKPTVEKKVTLLANNALRVRLTSNPGSYVILSVTGPFSKRAGYILGSYGADRKSGGTGFNRDLVWLSGQATAGF